MFEYPVQIHEDTLRAFNEFVGILANADIRVLSDYRPGDPRQHGQGRAIDFEVPNIEPLYVWELLRKARLFSGRGIYLSDKNAVSFHVDTRTDRTVDDPAIWGDVITHGVDPETGLEVRTDHYTTSFEVEGLLRHMKDWNGLMLGLLIAVMYIWKK